MAFGSNKRRCPADDNAVEEVDREVTEDTTNNDVDGAAGGGDPIDDDGYEEDDTQNGTKNPIFAEVTFLNTSKGKNDGGTRSWRCNHCKHSYRSSSTRIRMHFFGTQNGKKSPIGRCEALRSNREKYQELYDKVVTDNASNCKAAGKIIEKVYPHIFWTPCACHTLNLVFKDLAKKFTWMEDTYKTGKAIVNFFRGHLNCLAVFRNNSRLELLRVGKTRFASNYIMLERLNNCREALATTIVTKQWKDWMKGCSNEQNMETKAIVKAINDDDFWSEVETILAITEPIFSVLRFCDGEGPKIGEIYERMDTMIERIKDIMYKDGNLHKSDYSEIEDIIFSRWEKMNTPLQCLAYALSPRYYDKVYLEKEAPGGFRRKPPNEDLEVMEGVMEALRRVADSDHEYAVLRSQYNDFVMKRGMFALPAVKLDAGTMDPIKWWFSYGAQTLNLATVAARVLSQPVGSSSAERLWSTFGYIHSAKRNKLNVKTTDKLVYIHHNLRPLSRATEGYKNGAHASWDANPEDSLI